ncbi:MAG: glutamate-cysteine ligase family protein, partial [Fuerstiella sp.]
MSQLLFTPNQRPTIGVEIELQLVDADTMALANRIEDVLTALPAEQRDAIKPELMQSYLEINTDVCNTVRDAGTDLRQKLALVDGAAKSLGLELFWA